MYEFAVWFLHVWADIMSPLVATRKTDFDDPNYSSVKAADPMEILSPQYHDFEYVFGTFCLMTSINHPSLCMTLSEKLIGYGSRAPRGMQPRSEVYTTMTHL